jgi:hypothetical protein
MMTYDNPHKHEDFLSLEVFVYLDLQQNPMQLPVFHYVHIVLMQLFHLHLFVVLSNWNHIYGHVQ